MVSTPLHLLDCSTMVDGAGAITVLSCDNMPGNGEVVRTDVTQWDSVLAVNLSGPFLLGAMAGLLAFGLWAIGVPLAFLLWQSFFTPRTAAKLAELTLDNYRVAYSSSETARLFLNSVKFAVGTSIFAFIVGTGLAWMNERTNTPFKRLFFALALIPLIIPGILFTVSWIFLASPKIGLINLALKAWFGFETAPFAGRPTVPPSGIT